MIAEYLPGSPSSAEMVANISGCLVNSHSIYEVPMPRVPNYVNVLGTTIDKEVKPLPKDISDFMDGAEHGVVLLTMGMTYVPSGMQFNMKQFWLEMYRVTHWPLGLSKLIVDIDLKVAF